MAISLRLAGETEHISADAARHRAERPPFLPETPAPSAPGKGPPPLLGGGHRVLVVDDNEIVLKAFEMKLRAKGFVVATTTNSATVASTVEQAGA